MHATEQRAQSPSPYYINQMSNIDPYQYTERTPIEDDLFQLDIPSIPNKCDKNDDSLDNNIDNQSDKNEEGLGLMMGEDYEKNNHFLNDNNIMGEIGAKNESRKDDDALNEAESVLADRNSDSRYEFILKELMGRFDQIWTDKMVKLVGLVMSVKSCNSKEIPYFVRAIIFLKELWAKLSQVQNITKYHSLLAEILKITHPFYSIKLNQDIMSILELYLTGTSVKQDEEMCIEINQVDNYFVSQPKRFEFDIQQVEILESMLNEYFMNEVEIVPSDNQLYHFVFRNLFRSTFRKSVKYLTTNALLISRGPDPQTRDAYLEENQEGIYVQDFVLMEKRQIEEYATNIADIATENPKHAEKYIFRLVDWLLADNSQMEKKIIGFKILGELVGVARLRHNFTPVLVEWLVEHQILEKFLRESTHSRILQHISPILHFLYEHNILQNHYLVDLMKLSLHSEDLFKIVQTMLSWLKVEHLEEAFDMLNLQKQREKQPTSLLSQFVNALVSSPVLLGSNSRKRKNIMIQDNRRDLQEMQMEVSELSEKAEFLVKRLMRFLIQKVMADQQLFMPILLRHITAHMKLLKPQLEKQIISLLKNNSPAGGWILEQCLKIETSSHDQGQGQGKFQLIGRLANEGVYELILALIARHRYSRNVVDKCLSVVILFCRFHKPLERGAAEFLWKVLGLTASDEKEREQFFVFLKEIVRFEGAVSEQSVNFIFFELLMSLYADWFSPRVYDCLQMLFLRLNEDCKLISFQKDHYKIVQAPLIGADKLWYIYFNCPDLKVTKKCKDFIFKLIMNSTEKKQQLYQESLANIKKYLEASLELSGQFQNKQQILILRGFQMSQKLLLERQRIQQSTKYNTINLKIVDTTPNTFQKYKNLELNQKISLSDLKGYICDILNPPRRLNEIELLNKGKVLVGQNQTLKEMKLENNETITVALINTDIQPLSQTQKQEIKKQQLMQLYNLFGEEFASEFLGYIVDKFQGDTIQNIANIMFDQARIDQIREEYERSKEEAEQEFDIIEKKEEPKKFGEMLVETMENTQLLLKCLMISHNKKGWWKFLKELPINKDYFKIVEGHIQTGDWVELFKNKTNEQSKYVAYILTHIIRQSDVQSDAIFNEKKLREFLLQWICEVVETSMQKLEDYENIFKLLLISLNCPLFGEIESFVSGKKSNEDEHLSQKLANIMQIEPLCTAYISSGICCKLIDALLVSNMSEKMTVSIVKLYIYQLYYYYHQESAYSILFHPQLHQLLLRYGKSIYFAIISTALRLQFHQPIKSNFNLFKFTLKLLESYLAISQPKDHSFHFQAYFSCLQELLNLTLVHSPAEQLNALSCILHHIRINISILLEEEVIGYMKISLRLLNRHLQIQHGERRNDELCEFANWLFNQYLFGIHSGLPFFKNKGVRKVSYQLIHGLCSYHHINKHIVASITKLMNNCRGLEKEEGEFRTTEFIGMKNLGATCYINSLLQQLYHTIFPKLLLDEDTEGDGEIKLLELKKIFANLHIGVKSPVSTNKYVETVKINGEQIRPLVQQDVNEYFASLMHEIQQQVGNKAINSIMSGTFCHEIRGLQQGSQVKNVEETYLTLMIEMRGKKNLAEALSALSKQHILEGDNMYYSQVLHKKIRASSKTYLDKLPPLLVITLKRFYWNFETMTRHKINDYFEFPMELELSRYAIPGKKEVEHYYEYKLCGILIHSGSAESGHYYSFIKVGERWLEFNDRRVSEWDIQNNLKNQCFGGNEERNRNAYMLFYERIESQTHGASLHLLAEENRLIRQVKSQNESFIKNRLIYDSGYIDFIKDLAKMQGNHSLLDVLDGLNIHRDYEDPKTIDVDCIEAEPNKAANPDLNKKFDEITDYFELTKVNSIKEEDKMLSLLSPNQRGTENDKL